MTLAFLTALPQLIAAGLATEQEVKALVSASAPGMTEAEINAILALIVKGAAKHKAQADADLAKG